MCKISIIFFYFFKECPAGGKVENIGRINKNKELGEGAGDPCERRLFGKAFCRRTKRRGLGRTLKEG